jgi:hypothetical protein
VLPYLVDLPVDPFVSLVIVFFFCFSDNDA